MSVADGRAPSGAAARSAELDFRCPLAHGLHARPASHLAETAEGFRCRVELVGADGRSADARSVIAMIALDVRPDEACRLRFLGDDATAARDAFARFVADVLPGCDADVGGPLRQDALPLPRVLAAADPRVVRGTGAAPGIGRGTLVLAAAMAEPDAGLLDQRDEQGDDPQRERERVRRALVGLRESLARELDAGPSPTTAGILRAHLALARDVTLERAVTQRIDGGEAAPRAVWSAGRRLAELLSTSGSALVRERALDVEDLCLQLLERLGVPLPDPGAVALDGPSVLLAEQLAPRQLLALDRRHLAALVLASAGATSHAVILARSFGVPTLTGAAAARAQLSAGARVVVDADLGIALCEDDPRVRSYYDRRIAAIARRGAALAAFAAPAAITRDGHRIEVAANVASAEEAERAFANGADGIGLLRTEMLFLDRDAPPGEDEQVAVLTRALAAAAGRPVLVRTLDVGGDKPLPFLGLPREPNPFLGRRGVRLYPELAELIDTQLRAILRAAARGPLQLMVPMVATAAEVAWVRERVATLREELHAAGVDCGDRLPVGIMLEVPAAAFDLERLCAVADFVSLGTNDLAQYFFAADRENERVAGLHDPLQPSFLRLLRQIADELRARGTWLGMCGELARDPLALPLLVGLGLDEVSLSGPDLPAVKRGIAGLDARECRALLDSACACADAAAVRQRLAAFRRGGTVPLLTPELVVLGSAAATRAEAIAELAELLFVTFRTDDPLAVERAVWAREETYSTGLGGGFAIPHCKSDAVAATTLAVLRLDRPVDWDSLDGEPVRCALLLAVRGSDDERTHMRTFSALARRLVDEDFRAALLAAPDPEAVFSCLHRELALGSGPD
ncbi:MAG: phosphoenolpyruvate--protein phosphotransferase [Planctomycetes bacterium]|nr:phosphoenolpyruvate--protein phosphotransferase [Planctomycetota bacterium]